MKQEAIEKINQVGRIGLVLTVIASVAAYIFMIMGIAATIIIHNAPDSLATISTEANIGVTLDLSDADLDSTAVKTLQSYLEAGDGGAAIEFAGLSLYLHDYESKDNGGYGAFGGELSTFSFAELWKPALVIVFMLAVTVIMLLFNGFFANSLKKCASPFDEKVIKDGVNFSYLIVIWAVLESVLFATLKGMLIGAGKVDMLGIVIIVLSIVIFCLMRVYKAAADFTNK